MNRISQHPRSARPGRAFFAASVAALGVAATVALGALTGCGGTKLAPGEVAIDVTDEGFTPAMVRVPKGKPATLVFTRKVEATCATSMVFTASGEKHELPLHQQVRVTLPADRPDTLDYACGMKMLTGEVVSQ